MEFFVDNWFWFLLGGTVVLMTLIGYIAEKTDFGRKDMQKTEKPKKVKKSKKTKEQVEENYEEPKAEVQIALATDAILDEDNVQPIEQVEEFSGFQDISNEETSNDENIDFAPESQVENLEVPQNLEYNDTAAESLETLNVPIEDVVFTEPTEIVEPSLNYTDTIVPNIDLPDLDSIVTGQDDADDVWKF